MNLLYPVLGFVVGAVIGLTGVGGGSLMTPLLVFVFRVSPLTAVGTDLAFAAITKSVGLAAHGKRDQIDWHVFRWMALGSVPSAVLSILLLSWLKSHGVQLDAFVLPAMGVSLLFTAAALLYRNNLRQWVIFVSPQLKRIPVTARTACAGAVLGVLVSFTSVGAGALGVAAMMMLYPRMPAAKVVGTDLAHAVPLVAVAGLGHVQLGHLDPALLGSLLVGSLPGIWVGAALSSTLPEAYLRRILVGVLFAVGLVCIWR